MSEGMKVELRFRVERTGRGGRKELVEGAAPTVAQGRVPRVAKLLALALRFEGLLRAGTVKDYAELARLGHVTRARLTQIMNLTLLTPDIQEAVLFLPRVTSGRDPIVLRELQPLALQPCWRKQRLAWRRLVARTTPTR